MRLHIFKNALQCVETKFILMTQAWQFFLFQRLESLRRHTVINAVQQVKIPALTVTLSELGYASGARLVCLLLDGTVTFAALLERGEVVNYFFL